MSGLRVVLELVVPLDRAYLEDEAERRRVSVDTIIGEVAGRLENVTVDAARWLDGIDRGEVRSCARLVPFTYVAPRVP